MKIAKGCFGWVISPILLTLLFLLLGIYINRLFFIIFSFTFIVTIFFLIFFRDPDREIGEDIIAPADGKIRDIKVNEKHCFVSIFMDVNNVHVNRMPLDGSIIEMNHFPGKHFRAWKKESDLNERVVIDIESKIGKIRVIQIAGLIARRIYPYIKKGDILKKGDKIGIIRLSSRVDIYLPAKKTDVSFLNIDDKVYAGTSTIAKIR
jgi:phosphatidylserine decarboxylase